MQTESDPIVAGRSCGTCTLCCKVLDREHAAIFIAGISQIPISALAENQSCGGAVEEEVSYHSMVVPIVAAITALRNSRRWSAAESES